MTNRVTDYTNLLFEVRLVPVYAELTKGDGQSLQCIPGRRAVVSCDDDRILSVVGQGYQLVSNSDALEYARQCCATAFPECRAHEWEVIAADAPMSRGHCHIDLAHKTKNLNFESVDAGRRPDVYGPYVRVTNSYNRTRALGFDIGFMRKVCKNGLILDQSSVRFSFNHNTRRLPDRIRFEISKKRFQKLRAKFLAFLKPLRDCGIPRRCFGPITRSVLRIEEPKRVSRQGYKAWGRLQEQVESLCDKYVRELDETAYALLNVITDIASRPSDVGLNRRERHSLQRTAGAWLAEFSAECRKGDFDAARYVGKLEAAEATTRRTAARQPVHGLPRM